MKKIAGLLLIALFALTVVPAKAQVKFGIKGGVNISSVHFNKDILNSSNVTGFQVGPMIEAMMPMFGMGIDAAVLYSQKGVDASNSINSKSLKTDYLDIPVNLKWKFGLPIVKVYLAAGPYIGFRVGGDKIWDIPGQIDGELKAKNFNAGLNFGAGVELIKHLQVGFNYGLGLTDDFSASKVDLKAKNRGWSVTAAILF
ncbi:MULTISPECIES: porin family protein [Parabacteroides]|uniref:Outer membrane protein beta-barrel domain-containing protein n=1 Tax=Parabacteroides chinchillae TaxID=871327 RepID=A0A8G2F587_9BACT|nr:MULTISPECIES: porin family protein [Parabacteroides]SEG17699.1 Outer membrane protein beta-barrel domain-containing protein [Parabacteroides chinchillae]